MMKGNSDRKNPMEWIFSKERKYLSKKEKFQGRVIRAHENSPREGFERCFELFDDPAKVDEFKQVIPNWEALSKKSMRTKMLTLLPLFFKMMSGIRGSFKDLDPYFTMKDTNKPRSLGMKDKNENLWNELNEYVREKWGFVKVGFTKLPSQLVFKNKYVLFEHALVFMMEMNKEKIDQAPELVAGKEVMRVYADLGVAVRDIAKWLRKRGFRCQANHPLRGLTLTPPLAGKAGMGGQGKHGMLITPEFGPRHRLAPVFMEEKVFDYTDNDEHSWIEEYCKTCGKCSRACPGGAIFEEKQVSVDGVPGIGKIKTCIEMEKCFPYFNASFGCSICIKVCPFSKADGIYYKLKEKITTQSQD